MLRLITTALLACAYSVARPTTSTSRPLPLLIWHGLGDRFDNEGLQSVGELAQDVHPDTTVLYISFGETGDDDRKATFFGNVSAQIESTCEKLHNSSSILDPDSTGVLRVDALGFSQGGQFLRGLVERCEGLSVRSLLTYGSQHNGIAEFSRCGTWDFLCKGAIGLLKGNAFSEWAQDNVVPAQYYRQADPDTGDGTEEYLLASHFLADINNERELKNEQYKQRIASLDNFVMYMFENDTTVIPKESGWFAEVNVTSGAVTPLQQRELYTDDWLGLKQLDKKGGLVFAKHPGNHMQLEEELLREAFEKYFGPEHKTKQLQQLQHEQESLRMVDL